MKNKLKLVVAIFGISFLTPWQSFSQSTCTTTPVKDAVRNGDFELGYLTGPVGGKHTYTVGSDYDFYSDFDFVGSVPAYPTAACTYGIGDKYAIMRAENYTCASTNNWTNKGYWGPDYIGGGGTFADHTPGKAGKGFCYIADLNVRTTSPLTGGKPIAWAQTVDIIPSQNYYFSAWLANYNTSGNTPVMQVTIIPYRQSDGGADPAVTLAATGSPTGTMIWTQISSLWTPAGVYNKATIRLEFTSTAGGGSGLDVAIDDISFINSCQALSANTSPEFGYDTTSVCGYASGNVNLNANYPSPQSSNASYYWFEGTGSTQTQLAVPTTQQTYTTNKPGTYRVCVQDPDNGCAVNDVVVIDAAYSTSLPNSNLCNPATASLNATPSPSTGSPTAYAWTVPSGATNPGNASTATANVAGTYSVVVTGPAYNGGTCSASASSTVTSTLPVAPTNLEYCDGGGTATSLTLGDGKKYAWFTNAAATTPVTGSLATSTGTSVSWTPAVGTTGDRTLYIVSAETTPLATLQTTNWAWEATPSPIAITATQAVLLKSVQVKVSSWSTATSITFSVTGSLAFNVTLPFTATGADQTVNCNIALPPGTYSLSYTNSTNNGYWLANSIAPTSATGVSISGNGVGFKNMVFENSQACAPVPVVVKAISCCTPPTISTQPSNQTTCVNVATSPGFTVAATGATLTYQWQESTDGGTTWNNIAGATAATYAPTPTTTSWTGRRYRALIYTGGTCPATSNSATLTVNAATAITTQPTATTTICEGAAYSINVAGTGTGTLTYQWKLNGTNIPGATGTTYSIPSVLTSHAGTYTVDVTGTCGTVTSSNAILNVNDVNITTQPTDQGTCTGGNVTFSVVASGVGTITYQWQLSTDGGSSFNNIGGATSTSLAVNSVTIGMHNHQYRVITYSNSACPLTSNAAALTVNASTTINTQPAATTTICTPTGFTLTVSASGSGATSYVWYKDNVAIPSSNSSSYVVASSAAADAGVYKVEVTTSCGTATSSNATVTINGAGITTQPADQAACVNSTANFSVTAAGIATLEYQWQLSTNSGASFSNIAGATSSALSVASVTSGMNNYQYRVIVSSNGLCPATSNAAILTVNALTSITTQPSAQEACMPGGFSLSTSATGSGTLSYQWYKDNVAIPSATANTYSVLSATLADGGVYKVEVSSSNCAMVTSSNATVTVGDANLTASPASTATCVNGNASFNPTVTGTALTYQWQLSTGGAFSNISGETGATLNLTAVTASMNTYAYRVIIRSNGICPLTTTGAVLTVNNSTAINMNPAGTTVCEPAGFTLNTSASGAGAITYQWYKDGNPIAGATSASYSIASTTVADAGSYTVQANSSCGLSPMSAAATVVVQTAALATLTVTGNEACNGSASFVTVQSSQAGVSYQAFIGATSVSPSVAGTGSDIVLNITGTSLSPGNNTITVRATGCNAVDLPNATILVLSGDPGAITGNMSVCNNAKSSVSYSIPNVTGASTYTWTVSNGGSVVSGQSTTSIVASIASSSTTITVTPYTANGLSCNTASTTVNIISDYQFTDGLSASATNVCSGVPITITVTNPGAESYTNWTVPSGATIQSTTATSAVVIFGATSGNVTVQPVHQCNPGLAVLSTSVSVIPAPVANAGSDQQLDAIRPVTLDGSASTQSVNYTYTWTSSPSSAIQTPNTLITGASPDALITEYTLTIDVPGLPGCSSSDQMKVEIKFEVKVPNAFSPNGDGVHDVLIAKNIEYFPEAELTIYNQWGEVVYKTDHVYDEPWDGKRNGAAVPMTAYYYVLKLNVDGYKDLSGDINVLR